MKRDSIKPCIACGKGIAHDNNLVFFQVKITQLIIDTRAIQRITGLEAMLDSPALAQIMGSDEDLATKVGEQEAFVCMSCIGIRLDEIIQNISDQEN